MGHFILDSDILIDVARECREALALLDSLLGADVFISDFTKAELLVGARDGAHQAEIVTFLEAFKTLSPNASISEQALGILQKHYLAHGTHIVDACIAATAHFFELTLLSNNEKHFRPIKGLRYERPY